MLPLPRQQMAINMLRQTGMSIRTPVVAGAKPRVQPRVAMGRKNIQGRLVSAAAEAVGKPGRPALVALQAAEAVVSGVADNYDTVANQAGLSLRSWK